MHELSIATSIVEMAQEEAQARGAQSVDAIHLRLGPLSGVVKEALLSCFEIACHGTPLQGCRLEIEEVPVLIYCHTCLGRHELPSIQTFVCPRCGEPAYEVVQGRELEVVALEIEQCA